MWLQQSEPGRQPEGVSEKALSGSGTRWASLLGLLPSFLPLLLGGGEQRPQDSLTGGCWGVSVLHVYGRRWPSRPRKSPSTCSCMWEPRGRADTVVALAKASLGTAAPRRLKPSDLWPWSRPSLPLLVGA